MYHLQIHPQYCINIFVYVLNKDVVTIIPPLKPKRGKAEAKLRVHKTGSSRTEGYYKIPIAEKAQYLKSALKQLNVMQRHDIGTNTTSTQVCNFLNFIRIRISF